MTENRCRTDSGEEECGRVADYTGLHLKEIKSQEEKFIILIGFFTVEYEYENYFSQHAQISWNFMSKV